MATSGTVIEQRPYSCKVLITGDGTPGTLSYGASIQPNLAAGPLRTAMDRLYGKNNLDDLNLGNPSGNVIRTRLAYDDFSASVSIPTAFNIHWTASALSMQAAAGSSMLLEIRFQHSDDR